MDDLLVTKRPLSEVPADQSFFQPGPISERIEFPIEARARMGLLAWFLVPLGALCLGLSAFILADLPKSLHSPYDLLHTTIGATAFFVFGLSFIAAFLTLIYDRMKEAPLLILDAEGLLDGRSLQTIIPWSQIANAKIYVQGVTWGYAALRLKLRAPIDARHNPFRVGTPWFYAWRRRPDEIWVPVLRLGRSGPYAGRCHHDDGPPPWWNNREGKSESPTSIPTGTRSLCIRGPDLKQKLPSSL